MIGLIIVAAFQFHFMALAADAVNWRGLSNETSPATAKED